MRPSAIKSMPVMQAIDHFNLRAFDLNLLIAFDAMIEEGSVTRAARRLKIGQPAMSHNISTLRMLFEDELFIRVGQTMQPTARARTLAGPIRNALRQAQAALLSADVFDPATESRVFRLGMSAEVQLLLLPDLTARMRKLAPGVRILARACLPDQVDAMIDSGALDMAIGCTYSRATRQVSEVLYEADVQCCYNPALLSLGVPVSLEDYLTADHAVISQSENLHGCVEDALEFAGADLNVVAAGPDFMSVLSTAKASPVIATISARIARRYASLMGLVISPVPLDLRFPPVTLVWPAHADKDTASVWLRDQIREVFNQSQEWPAPRIAAQ
jgi:LysR family transcriptional activator of mexEF-oprN operon